MKEKGATLVRNSSETISQKFLWNSIKITSQFKISFRRQPLGWPSSNPVSPIASANYFQYWYLLLHENFIDLKKIWAPSNLQDYGASLCLMSYLKYNILSFGFVSALPFPCPLGNFLFKRRKTESSWLNTTLGISVRQILSEIYLFLIFQNWLVAFLLPHLELRSLSQESSSAQFQGGQ